MKLTERQIKNREKKKAEEEAVRKAEAEASLLLRDMFDLFSDRALASVVEFIDAAVYAATGQEAKTTGYTTEEIIELLRAIGDRDHE